MAEENKDPNAHIGEQVAVDTEQEQANESPYTPSERFVAAVGYISFLCLLPLILRRDSDFCQFHGKQALFVCIMFFALRFLFIVPVLGTVFTIIEIVSIIILCYLTWTGSMFHLPFFGKWAEQLRLSREEEEAAASEEAQAAAAEEAAKAAEEEAARVEKEKAKNTSVPAPVAPEVSVSAPAFDDPGNPKA